MNGVFCSQEMMAACTRVVAMEVEKSGRIKDIF